MDISNLLNIFKGGKGAASNTNNYSSSVTTSQASKPSITVATEGRSIQNTGTYKRIIELLPEEALSNLPNEVFKCLGFSFVAAFKEALTLMRKRGIAYLIYGKIANQQRLFLPCEADNFKAEQDSNTKEFRYYLNNQEISPGTVLVFGDAVRLNRAKLHVSEEQKQTIIRYEQALDIFYRKLHTSYAWIFKIAGLEDIYSPNNDKSSVKKRVEDIARRKHDSVIYCDKEDEFQVAQMDLGWFEGFIKEYKTKICVDFNIPFTKFFGEAATGFNATGEGDRRSWYDTVKTFQALYIFEQLKQLAQLQGKEAAFKQIVLEDVETTDKELEANIQSIELNNILAAYNNGLLEEEEAKRETLRILNIKQEQQGVN